MKCDSTHYINIIYAMYGRMERDRCTKRDVPQGGCQAKNSLQRIKNHIQNTCGVKPYQCTALASNNIFGDPCGGVQKYLELKYECKLRTESMYFELFSIIKGISFAIIIHLRSLI